MLAGSSSSPAALGMEDWCCTGTEHPVNSANLQLRGPAGARPGAGPWWRYVGWLLPFIPLFPMAMDGPLPRDGEDEDHRLQRGTTESFTGHVRLLPPRIYDYLASSHL